MQATTANPKFQPGVLLATPGASEAFQRNRQTPFEFLKRHLAGDWGEELCQEDRLLNDRPSLMAVDCYRPTASRTGPNCGASPRLLVRTGGVKRRRSCSPRNTNRQEPCYAGRIDDAALSELLRVFRVRNEVDQRMGLRVQRPLPEVFHGDRALRFGRTLTQGPGPATPLLQKQKSRNSSGNHSVWVPYPRPPGG